TGSRTAGLERARESHARRAWQEAYEAFAAADAVEPLGLADLELWAPAALLSGDLTGAIAALERIYEANFERGDGPRAARAAFYRCMRLSSMGEPARAGGWMARAQRLVDGKDCAERGYLLLPSVRRLETAGDSAAAEAAAVEAQAIGDRFRDPDL